jgi:hypothetical protein
MIARADAGKAGADDQHVEMLKLIGRLHGSSNPVAVMAGP